MKNETIFMYNTKKTSEWPWGASILILLQIMAGISIWQFLLGHFPVLHKIVITYQNDVKLKPWPPDDSKTPSQVFQASSHMPHHHICHVISFFDFLWLSLTFTEFCPAIMSWLVLGHYGTLLDINDNSCQHQIGLNCLITSFNLLCSYVEFYW